MRTKEPRAESLDWLNALLRKLWPRIDKAVQKIIHEKVTPRIQSSMPTSIPGLTDIYFSDFTLGEFTPPTLGPIKVQKTTGGAKLVLSLDYVSQTDIGVCLGGATFGLRNLCVTGDLVVHFDQLIDQMPVVGGVILYFLDPPRIDFSFAGLARIAGIPAISGAIREAVDSAIASFLVLPNQLTVPFAGEPVVDLSVMKLARPIGLLRLIARSARALRSSDRTAPRESFNAHVWAQMADVSWKSSTANGTPDIAWNADEREDFMIFDEEQRLWISLMDELDGSGSGEVIGQVKGLTVSEALRHKDEFHLHPKVLVEDGFVRRDVQSIDQRRSCYWQANSYLSNCVMRVFNPGSSADHHDPERIDVGRLRLGFQFLEMVPHKLCGDLFLLRVKVDEVSLPRGLGCEAKVAVTIPGIGSKATPLGIKRSGEDETSQVTEALKGIVTRLHTKHMLAKDIAEVTSLDVEVVERVIAGGQVAEQNLQNTQVIIEVEATLWFKLPPSIIKDAHVEVAVANGNDEVLMDQKVPLSQKVLLSTLAHSPGCEKTGTIKMSPNVDADVSLSLLGTTVCNDESDEDISSLSSKTRG
eukprot:TRINITY_DN54784_c0_g1_i1.p1 TRINITY_DN54784_c0_g1~~TRINITY_DN54784_c0_g1_i1.p1  ORF type:complete len:584 (-),score=103.78 TRINITY_DN54784_c0_g1_i1:109-1860(-)